MTGVQTCALPIFFIDADHTYEGVKQDFDQYSPLVAPGGLIALHDIGSGNPNARIQVPRFWAELKGRFPGATEWLDETPNGRRIGIGMIEWPGLLDARIAAAPNAPAGNTAQAR